MLPHVNWVFIPWDLELACSRCALLIGACRDQVGVEYSIQSELEHVVDHSGDKHFEETWRFFDAGIRVDLYHVTLEVLIDDEIIANELEGELSYFEFPFNGFKRVDDQVSMLLIDFVLNFGSIEALALSRLG